MIDFFSWISVYPEIVLLVMACVVALVDLLDTSAQRNEIIQIANIFRASIIDVSLGSLTLAVIGTENKTDAIQKLVSEFGILELVRTGMVALERGLHTINEETKEKGEFDYGKNVL